MTDLRVTFPKPCGEQWDNMRPDGCNRFCGRCGKTIHDLDQLTFDEAEALATSSAEVCVRARLGEGGVVALKPSERNGRRIVAAVGASIGLLASAGQLAAADNRATGVISGSVAYWVRDAKVTAIGTDGKKYRAKVDEAGRYAIRNVPPGAYRLRFSVRCYDDVRQRWDGTTVVVEEDEVAAGEEQNGDVCPIIVGVLKVEDPNG